MLRAALALLPLAASMPSPSARTPTPFASREPLVLRAASLNSPSVPRYGKLELTLDLSATYDNPFDPDDIDVWADLRPPKGSPTRANGFLWQPFTRMLKGGKEQLDAAGRPVWKVRFAPAVEGAWTVTVHARDRSGTVSLKPTRFRVTKAIGYGFVRRSARNPLYFAFDNGKPFFAVGENMGWAGDRGTFEYDDWLRALGKAGGNWIRVWMCSWNCALEWSEKPHGENRRGTYYGVGIYSLDNAWKLDRILDEAERNGIYTMVCFGTYGEFNTGGFFNEGEWPANPYNVANGGPCAKPDDFWTNPAARKLYQRRLRYIAARYGYRTAVHSWEFWNEKEAPAAWAREMAQFLKGAGPFAAPADPARHLVTNTYGNPAVWRIPEVDFTQSHHYGTGNVPDHATVIHADAAAHLAYGKPHLMAEFGIDWRDTDRKYDPDGKGVNLHNGLWAGLASGDAGTGMLWWWDSYVHPLNLYRHFTPVRRFADSVNWSEGAWRAMDIGSGFVGNPIHLFDLVIPASSGWAKSANDYTITPAGVKNSASMPQYLFGPDKPDLRSRPTFHVQPQLPSRFTIHVDSVSDHVALRIALDGKPVSDVPLSALPPSNAGTKPEYKSTRLRPEYNSYEAKFDRDISIELPPGPHTVTLDVVEGDWLSVETYRIGNYSEKGVADLQLYGMENGREGVLWAHNAAYNWKNVYDHKQIDPAAPREVLVHGLAPGPCKIEWWDTWKGEVTRREYITAGRDGLRVKLPRIDRDIALHITTSRLR